MQQPEDIILRLFRLFKKDIACEVEEWIDEGLIDHSQGESILARYGASLVDARSSSLGYYVLSALAALFVGLALLLILSHNWDQIPRLTRMLGLMALTLSVNLTGVRYLYKGTENTGILWLFFGSICYGATIMLIGQIYHIGEHYPDGIFFWSLGILPLIFLTRSRLIALLCLVLATIWMFVETAADFFPYSYPLFPVAGLWLAWIRRDSNTLFLGSLAGLVIWLNLFLAWAAGDFYRLKSVIDQFPVTISCGLLLAGFAIRLTRSNTIALQHYGQSLHLWLLRGSLFLLFILSFDNFWKEFIRDTYFLGFSSPLFIPASGLIAFYWSAPSGLSSWGPIVCNAIFFALSFGWIAFGNGDKTTLALLSNFMLVFSGVWLIRRGIDNGITHYFYTGITVLLLTALFRYFDLIGEYIGGALLFIVAAAIMLFSARYWRSRSIHNKAENV